MVKVADVDLNPLLVNSLRTVRLPVIWEIVADVERKLLLVNSPEMVRAPLRVVMVALAVRNSVVEATPPAETENLVALETCKSRRLPI